jgi:hypothetical protein
MNTKYTDANLLIIFLINTCVLLENEANFSIYNEFYK